MCFCCHLQHFHRNQILQHEIKASELNNERLQEKIYTFKNILLTELTRLFRNPEKYLGKGKSEWYIYIYMKCSVTQGSGGKHGINRCSCIEMLFVFLEAGMTGGQIVVIHQITAWVLSYIYELPGRTFIPSLFTRGNYIFIFVEPHSPVIGKATPSRLSLLLL